jgi:hypothetical protein
MTTVTRWTVEMVGTLPRLEGGREAMIDGGWQAMTAHLFRHDDEALPYVAMLQPGNGSMSPLTPGSFCEIERFCAI